MLGNLNFSSAECMLVDIPHAEVVKAFRVALDFLPWRHIVILARTARVGSCNEHEERHKINYSDTMRQQLENKYTESTATPTMFHHMMLNRN